MNSLIEIAAEEIKQLADVEPKEASKKFELIASTMNDEQLVEVIEHMDIVTLTQINSNHDISCPSIMSELMTPEQIKDIVCQQPLYWEEKIKTNADELAQQTFDFMTYLIRVQPNEEKQKEILECIAEEPAGLFYLSIPFIELLVTPTEADLNNNIADVFDDEADEETVGYTDRTEGEDAHSLEIDDPRSLLALIKELAPDVEKAIKNLLRNENSNWQAIIGKFVTEVVTQAKEKNETVSKEAFSEVDDMFTFLD
ncbi:MAG: cold adaptation protein AtcB [Parashewanella sp.]